jgi:hypothetical protein
MVVFNGVICLIPVICAVTQSCVRYSEKASGKPTFVESVAMVILSEPVADIEEALRSLRVVSVGNTALVHPALKVSPVSAHYLHNYLHTWPSVPGLFVLLIWIKVRMIRSVDFIL